MDNKIEMVKTVAIGIAAAGLLFIINKVIYCNDRRNNKIRKENKKENNKNKIKENNSKIKELSEGKRNKSKNNLDLEISKLKKYKKSEENEEKNIIDENKITINNGEEIEKKTVNADGYGNYFVGDHSYNLTDNKGKEGTCLWNILRNHGISSEVLKLAAKKTSVNVDSYVDIKLLPDLFKIINDNGVNIGYKINIIDYDKCKILNDNYCEFLEYNPLEYNPNAFLVLDLCLFINSEKNGDGHYVESNGTKKREEKEKEKDKQEEDKKKKYSKEEVMRIYFELPEDKLNVTKIINKAIFGCYRIRFKKNYFSNNLKNKVGKSKQINSSKILKAKNNFEIETSNNKIIEIAYRNGNDEIVFYPEKSGDLSIIQDFTEKLDADYVSSLKFSGAHTEDSYNFAIRNGFSSNSKDKKYASIDSDTLKKQVDQSPITNKDTFEQMYNGHNFKKTAKSEKAEKEFNCINYIGRYRKNNNIYHVYKIDGIENKCKKTLLIYVKSDDVWFNDETEQLNIEENMEDTKNTKSVKHEKDKDTKYETKKNQSKKGEK